MILAEEKAAMDAGIFARIPLKPSRHFEGLTGQEFHFRLAESQFLRMCGSHLAGQYRVKLVELIVNPPLRSRYDAFVQEERRKGGGVIPPEHLTFHGTSTAAVEKIIQEGFRIGGVDTPMATAAALGHGIYSSEDPAFACGYIKDGRTQLLFSRVCPSSDSVISKGADGVIQQLVVKSRDQILPLYIVHFAPHSGDDGAMGGRFPALGPMMGQTNFLNAMNLAQQIRGGAYPPPSYSSRSAKGMGGSRRRSSANFFPIPPPASPSASPPIPPPPPLVSATSIMSAFAAALSSNAVSSPSSPAGMSSPSLGLLNSLGLPSSHQSPSSQPFPGALSARQQQMLSLYSPQALSTASPSTAPSSRSSRPRSSN